jgi:hypothetical protein
LGQQPFGLTVPILCTDVSSLICVNLSALLGFTISDFTRVAYESGANFKNRLTTSSGADGFLSKPMTGKRAYLGSLAAASVAIHP